MPKIQLKARAFDPRLAPGTPGAVVDVAEDVAEWYVANAGAVLVQDGPTTEPDPEPEPQESTDPAEPAEELEAPPPAKPKRKRRPKAS